MSIPDFRYIGASRPNRDPNATSGRMDTGGMDYIGSSVLNSVQGSGPTGSDDYSMAEKPPTVFPTTGAAINAYDDPGIFGARAPADTGTVEDKNPLFDPGIFGHPSPMSASPQERARTFLGGAFGFGPGAEPEATKTGYDDPGIFGTPNDPQQATGRQGLASFLMLGGLGKLLGRGEAPRPQPLTSLRLAATDAAQLGIDRTAAVDAVAPRSLALRPQDIPIPQRGAVLTETPRRGAFGPSPEGYTPPRERPAVVDTTARVNPSATSLVNVPRDAEQIAAEQGVQTPPQQDFNAQMRDEIARKTPRPLTRLELAPLSRAENAQRALEQRTGDNFDQLKAQLRDSVSQQPAPKPQVAPRKSTFGAPGTAFAGTDIPKLVETIQQTTPYRSIAEFGAAVRSGEAAKNGAPQGLIDLFQRGEREVAAEHPEGIEAGLAARGNIGGSNAQATGGVPAQRGGLVSRLADFARGQGGEGRLDLGITNLVDRLRGARDGRAIGDTTNPAAVEQIKGARANGMGKLLSMQDLQNARVEPNKAPGMFEAALAKLGQEHGIQPMDLSPEGFWKYTNERRRAVGLPEFPPESPVKPRLTLLKNFNADEAGEGRADLGLTGRKKAPPTFDETHVQNILSMYNAASEVTKAAGREWYPNLADTVAALADATGLPVQRPAAAVAALSRQTQWALNKQALYDQVKAILNGATEPPRTGTLYQSNDVLAHAILTGKKAIGGRADGAFGYAITDEPTTRPLDALGQPGSSSGSKSRDFAANALDIQSRPVVDTIAARIAEGGKLALTKGGQPKKVSGVYYDKLQAAYDEVARRTGERPDAAQAIPWIQAHGGAEANPAGDFGIKGPVKVSSNDAVKAVANDYLQSIGQPGVAKLPKVKVDPAVGKQIADAYESAVSNPGDPATQRAYAKFVQETEAQAAAIKKAGYTLEPWTKPGQPYADSNAMRSDVMLNKHLYYFAGGEPPHGLMTTAQNETFRGVHDFFGHAMNGNEFGPNGEENAWLAHSQMYTPEARAAMTTETRGQNSTVNFGSNGEANRANPANTIYPEQKAILLPPEFHTRPEIASPAPSLMSRIREFGGDQAGSGRLDLGMTGGAETPAQRAARAQALREQARTAPTREQYLNTVPGESPIKPPVAPGPQPINPQATYAARQTLADRMGVDAKTGMPLGGAPRGGSGAPLPPQRGGLGLLQKAEGVSRTLKGIQTALSPAHFMGRHALPTVAFPDAYLSGPGGMLKGIASNPAEAESLRAAMQEDLALSGHPDVTMQNIHSGVVGGAEDTTSFTARNPLLNAVLTPFQRSSQGFVMGLNTVRYTLTKSIDSWIDGAVSKGWMAPPSAADRAGIDRAINVNTGIGFQSRGMGEAAKGTLRLANTAGPFSPQMLGARVKMLGYGTKGLADVASDLAHRRPVNADAAVRARLGMGALVGIGGMYALTGAAGVAAGRTVASMLPEGNPVKTTFGQQDMGKPSLVNGLLSGLASQLGVGASTYAGKDTMFNPTESEAGLIRTAARTALSIYDALKGEHNLQTAEGTPSEDSFDRVIEKELLSQLFSSPLTYDIVQYLANGGKYPLEPLNPVLPMTLKAGLTGGGMEMPTVGGKAPTPSKGTLPRATTAPKTKGGIPVIPTLKPLHK